MGYKNDISIIKAWLQISAYPISVLLAAFYVSRTFKENLRSDSNRISNINTFIIRAAFFAVFYIGLADAFISFLRVEGLLPVIFGDELAINLGKSFNKSLAESTVFSIDALLYRYNARSNITLIANSAGRRTIKWKRSLSPPMTCS